MPTLSTAEPGALLVAGAAARLAALGPVVEAHRRQRRVELLELPEGAPPEGWWRDRLAGIDAVLLAVDARVSPGAAVPGTHLADRVGALVPVGLVPPGRAAPATMAAVLHRARGRLGVGPVVLLGSRAERAQRLATEIEAVFAKAPRPPFRRLTAERLARYALPAAIAQGAGVALYVGHGQVRGWEGYGGVEAWRLEVPGGRPVGAVLSLSCHGAARIDSVPSFSEELLSRGVAAAALGAVGEVSHAENASLALAISNRIANGARTLADALPPHHPALPHYRIIGDPLAPLVGARGARRGSAAVFAPAPGDPLPAVDWGTTRVTRSRAPSGRCVVVPASPPPHPEEVAHG